MYYFAYGSNLNRKQMAERCPNSKPKFTTTLPHHKLIFAGRSRKWGGGTASIKPFRGEKVAGAVYEVSDRDLRALDQAEGPDYSRVNKIVFTDTGERIEVVTYVKREQSEETPPSPEYLAAMRRGYRDWEID